MQQIQLAMFFVAVAALVVTGCILTRKPRKNYSGKPCGQRCQTNISPAVSVSKKKGAVIGGAAARRPLRKLGLDCDRSHATRRGGSCLTSLDCRPSCFRDRTRPRRCITRCAILGAVGKFLVIIRQLEHHPLRLRVFYFIR
jgi:hypothetical protein